MNTIGIDVSKEKLDCAWLKEQDKVKTKVFANKRTGWQDLLDWSLKNTGIVIAELHFVMEATGIYHEQLATFLYEAGANVSVVNPAQVNFYAQGLGIRSKNDKKDSVVLARYGSREHLKHWQTEAPEIRTLKALLARFDGIEKDLQREKNRQEKAQISLAPDEVMNSLNLMIAQLETEQQRLEKLIAEHINRHDKLKENKALLESIPAVGNVIATRMLMVIGSR